MRGTRAHASMQQKMMHDMYSNMYSILQSAIERENITADDNNMQYRYPLHGLDYWNDDMVIHLRYFWNKENTNSKAFREEYYPNRVTNDHYPGGRHGRHTWRWRDRRWRESR